jgi:hypothetical protein
MKAALVDANDIVVNVIVWDETCVAPDGTAAVILDDDFHVSVGWIYNGEQSFVDPNPPIQASAPAAPTLADLQAQLAALTASIQALSGGN